MNADSEQITLDQNLMVAPDQPLSDKELKKTLISVLGADNVRIIDIPKRKWVLEYRNGDKCVHLLVRSCTYLGNPHPIYKKRIQLPLWFNEYVAEMKIQNPTVDIRYIGVYHYSQEYHGTNIIFIDFNKDTYIEKKGHNSSAHVSVNDLFQAMSYGVFSKEDNFGNTVTTVRKDRFAEYLNGNHTHPETLFDLFRRFNNGFSFGEWLKAVEVIREMHEHKWGQWRQAEWPGWYLEYKFNDFTIENGVTRKMCYVGSSQKHKGDFDFDIRFEDEDFYGDLKASDIKKSETPGNDQDTLVECIFQYNKFWYVIYEHDTIKDRDRDYEATIGRNRYIREIDPTYTKDDMSYHQRMKNSVRFVKMTIIELNRINFREALVAFNQGRQPDGKSRKPKFCINKKVLSDDNYVVFRYTYEQK